MQRTGDPLDAAIDGKGYFVVQTPRGQRYTRNGAFGLNATGQLVTSSGDVVLGTTGPINFQPTDHDIIISTTGVVSARDGSGTLSVQRGQLQLVDFDNAQQLQKDGASTFQAAPQCESEADRARHSHRAGLDREIECAPHPGNDADDRDHPQLFRHRRDPAAARRPAPKLAAAAFAGGGYLGLMVRIKDHACA